LQHTSERRVARVDQFDSPELGFVAYPVIGWGVGIVYDFFLKKREEMDALGR
jgi:hypothetical protein